MRYRRQKTGNDAKNRIFMFKNRSSSDARAKSYTQRRKGHINFGCCLRSAFPMLNGRSRHENGAENGAGRHFLFIFALFCINMRFYSIIEKRSVKFVAFLQECSGLKNRRRLLTNGAGNDAGNDAL